MIDSMKELLIDYSLFWLQLILIYHLSRLVIQNLLSQICQSLKLLCVF